MAQQKSIIEYSDDVIVGTKGNGFKDALPPMVKSGQKNNLYMYNYELGIYELIEADDIGQYVYTYFLTQGLAGKWKPSLENDIVKAVYRYPRIQKVEKMNDYDHLINLKNGLIDLNEEKEPDKPFTLIKHSPDYFFTSAVDIDYKPEETDASNFIESLQGIFRHRPENRIPGEPDYDTGSVNAIIRLGGYILFPQNKIKRMFIFYGQGANGKSIIMEHVYKMFFTEEHMSSLSLNALSSESSFAREQLVRSRINFATEQKAGDIESEELKKIISGETISVDRKNKDWININPNCKILIAANRLPRFKDTTYGTDRRLHIFYFPNKFVNKQEYKEEDDPESRGIYVAEHEDSLVKKLRSERSAILNLFLGALQDLRINNWHFPTTENSNKIKKEYKEESDPIGTWINERYKRSRKGGKEIITVKSIMDSYSIYQSMNNTSSKGITITSRYFSKRIKEIFRIESFRHDHTDPGTGNRTSGPAFFLKDVEEVEVIETKDKSMEEIMEQIKMKV